MSNRPAAAAALAWLAVSVLALAPVAQGAVGPDVTQKLYDRVTPSLVAVKFTWENELGRRELVGAGIVAFAVSDIGYAYLNLVGAYASGGVTDIGWFAGFSLILLAARKPVDASEVPMAQAEPGEGAQPFGVLLPYVAVLAALLVSVVWFARTGQGDAFVSYARSALILLIVGRQLLGKTSTELR